MFNRLIALLLLAGLLVACGSAPQQPAAAPMPTSEAAEAPALRQVTLAMSYIPNIQFAPYYVTAAQGYFAEEGIEVNFDYNYETDVLQRAANWPADNIAFATASGTSTLLARQQGIPVKTVMTLYQEFPVVFFAKRATGLTQASDLIGKTVGIPGNFGESYYGLLAVRYANDLDESAFPVEVIGFTQAQAVLEDQVQVALGYAMNEPVLLRQQGEAVDVLRVADVYDLAANGIVVSEQLLAEEPELVRGFIRAALRGLQDTLDNPDLAFDLSLAFIPEAQLSDVELQRQVLIESLPYWHSSITAAEGLGFTDIAVWQRTEQFMRDVNLLAGPVAVEEAFTNEFLP
ncbi:ABC transporter substrate-binding protein [Candidatus Viridilinea mediisalina]|uniref:Myristoyl transferase n=1 Tax=Candidatus Viridilinea mediisalina TaxID=2024553 RepID=A0A2A6RDE5_9CHLR|nr:ABC transporter substrate-binding protein [Candidatus Viridilinea mediisalina]PDV98375.1 myristoyl transferase [Candidatus Viridilinea mediisalina]